MNTVHFAIPEIYGETLSYYELLRKLVDKVNELVDNYDTIPDQIAEEVKDLDASQLFSAVLEQLIDSIATDNTKSANAVKVYKKHDLLYATFNETVNLYESLIDFTTGTETELIVGTNIREVNISELFIELRKLIEINKNNIKAVTAVANKNSTEIETINDYLAKSKTYVTPQMFGAVGDGVHDDTNAIKTAIASRKPVCIPNGSYKITESLEIPTDTTIYGLNSFSQAKVNFVFYGCDGFIFNGARCINICGINVIAENVLNEFCALKFIGGSCMKINFENGFISNFKYGVSDCLEETATTIWNCGFRHIRSDNVEFLFYLSQDGKSNNNFGIICEDIYSDNSKIYINSSKMSWIGCNFGIRQTEIIRFSNNNYMDFENCNFEHDEDINGGSYSIYLNGTTFYFLNCQFVCKGDDSHVMISTGSSLTKAEFIGCVSTKKPGAHIWSTVGQDAAFMGAIVVNGGSFEYPNFSNELYNAYCTPGNSSICRFTDTTAHQGFKNFIGYNSNRNQVEYKNGENYVDVYNNKVSEIEYPIKIGKGFWIDGGTTQTSNNVAVVNFNRKVQGQVFVSVVHDRNNPTDYIAYVDSSDLSGNYAVIKIKKSVLIDVVINAETGATDKVKKWVDNDSPVTIHWFKISR